MTVIRTTTLRPLGSRRPTPSVVAPKPVRAVWMGDRETGIVTALRDDSDRQRGRRTHVIDLVDLSAGVDAAVAWLAQASAVDVTIVADEALGGALWKSLRIDELRGAERRVWELYTDRGRDRMKILEDTIWGTREGRLTADHGLPGAGVMKRAMLANRTVGDDGVIGSALFSSLCLVHGGKVPGVPRIY